MSGESTDWNDIVNSYIFAACPLCQSNYFSLQCRNFKGSYREKDKNNIVSEIVSIIYNQDITKIKATKKRMDASVIIETKNSKLF